MKTRQHFRRRVQAILGVLVVLGVTGPWLLSQNAPEGKSCAPRRVALMLKGGYAHAETRGAMADILAEVRFRISRNVAFGLGVGYLADSDGMHRHGDFARMEGGMMGGMPAGMQGGFAGHSHTFRVVPLLLQIVYSLPVGPNIDVLMIGGGGYYAGSFRDISTQKKSAFGPHAGIGWELRVAERVAVVAEGVYRWVSLKDFTSELHPGFRDIEGEAHQEGFWHFHHGMEEWHFHEVHEEQMPMIEDTRFFDISLTGFSLRAGIRFSF